VPWCAQKSLCQPHCRYVFLLGPLCWSGSRPTPLRLPASTAHSSISPFRSHARIHSPRPRNSCALYLYPLHYRFIYRSQNNDETSNTPLPYPFFGFRSMRWRPPGAILTRYVLHLASCILVSALLFVRLGRADFPRLSFEAVDHAGDCGGLVC